jgi:antitoxin component YwqK of YwqJK toxin-antitoxin module/lipopolysaccharide biosynthesis regulator YciM
VPFDILIRFYFLQAITTHWHINPIHFFLPYSIDIQNPMMRHLILILSFMLLWGATTAQNDSLIHPRFHIERGKMLVDSGKFKQAIKQFKFIDPRDTSYVLALKEMANAYFENEQYDEAIAAAAKGLLKPSPYRSVLLITQGMAYTEKGAYDKARATYELGLKEFPFYPPFILQYGRMLYAQDNYAEAEKYFFKVLETSPFNSSAHLHLGIISLLRGEKVNGMMAMGIYMALNNTANSRLVTLERFVKNELTDEFSVPPSEDNAFARLDEIIRSKIAMEDGYKTKIPINAGIVKQYQLLFEQLAAQDFQGNSAWVTFYLPIYKSLAKANAQEAFIYHILKSSSIKVVPEWTSKNGKSLQQFYDVINSAITRLRGTRTLEPSWGIAGPVSHWYDGNSRLDAIGNMNAKEKRVGQWYFFADNGTLIAKGVYDAEGKKTGLWNYYNESGVPTSFEQSVNGEQIVFNEQGKVRQKFVLKNNAIEGELINYNACGGVEDRIQFKEGNREGASLVYSITGAVLEKLNYVKDSLHGKYQYYYESGVLQVESNYKNGKLHETFKRYHPNGKLASHGAYDNGNAVGPWKFYHNNGVVKEEGEFKNDLPVGEFKYYNRYGVLTEKRQYNDSGKFDGDDIFYHNGALHYKLINKNDIPVEATYYDLQGKVIATVGDANGTFKGKGYYPTGELRSEYQYEKGKATGTWKYYERTGQLERADEYADGNLHGKAIEYFSDKRVKSITSYKEGELHGRFESFYENGNKRVAGWYQDGMLQQQWLTFYANGKIKDDDYYLNDKLVGSSYYYSPTGELISESIYDNGLISDVIKYNPRGEVISSTITTGNKITIVTKYKSGKDITRTDVVCGKVNGNINTYLPDGKPYFIQNFVNNKSEGENRNFSADGSLEFVGSYQEGNSVGVWTWYYPNSKPELIGNYVNDERDSLWTYYHENGKLSAVLEYRDGSKHGIAKYYSPDGVLILEKKYDEGDLIAYRDVLGKDTQWKNFSGTGTIRAHYADGKPAIEENFLNGVMHGVCKLFYTTGIVFSSESFSEGLNEGASVFNHPTGKLRVKKLYKDDNAEGRWEYFNAAGQREKVENYSVGLLHGATEFYSNGVKTKEVKFWYGIPTE